MYKRINGDVEKTPSVLCPKCHSAKLVKKQSTEQVFNEHGWFSPISIICDSCGHSWVEEFQLKQ